MSSKEYVFIEKKPLYGKIKYVIKDRIEIKCIGGENMPKEKPELVFIETKAIPRVSKGKVGRDWKELFATIPEGKSAIIPEDYGTGATVRSAVKNINKELETETYTVTQRTVNEVTVIYVSRK